MIKFQKYNIFFLSAICLLFGYSCKQELLEGPKASGNEPFKVYFLNGTDNGIINGLSGTDLSINRNERTADFPIRIFRGGQAGSEPFTVKVTADVSTIEALIQSGALPVNTVVLDAASFTFQEDVTLTVEHDMMKGNLLPRIKIDQLEQYIGQHVAIGFKISGTSRYTINEEMDNVVLFFNVNSLAGPVQFTEANAGNNPVINVANTSFTVNTTDNEVNIPVNIQRAGSADLGNFTVNVEVDNSKIADMIQSGALPANTVTLSPLDYSLDTEVTLSRTSDGINGNVIPKIKINNLDQYSGQKAVLGLKLKNSSEFSINPDADQVLIYFDVDSLLDEAQPPVNLLDPQGWTNLTINNDNNVVFTINDDGSIKATGGSWGHAGAYQAIEVRAGKKYKIDMRVKGSGATDVWYEVYVGTAAPVQGSDYSSGGSLLALNTWTGCGKSAFDAQLSSIACAGNGGVFTATATQTMYVVIKSGGADLGAQGITASNIDLRRVP
ncbi:DUF1735 domain-containing protein [Gynurincola endophyticus]|uniref:DUF1735 domain-containing protein n=1 Tax=Gynurincola endophyticus TaxID=2479004 RepID=UPI000F8D0DE9|nr:DUF1735 domain-containing protein [Gynurincola endophyticus]